MSNQFSNFVKFAHVVKLYVAFMRNLLIDKIHPKSAAFCIRFQFFTYMSGFYNVVQTGYRQILSKIGDRSKTANRLFEPPREKTFRWSSCSRFASLCPCRYRNKHKSFTHMINLLYFNISIFSYVFNIVPYGI